jgi:hypothetical protein
MRASQGPGVWCARKMVPPAWESWQYRHIAGLAIVYRYMTVSPLGEAAGVVEDAEGPMAGLV